MYETHKSPRTVWLRTDRPVVPMNASMWNHLPAVESALHHGVMGMQDTSRPEFYDLEIGGNWYYIHIPSRIAGVYLVAAGREHVKEERIPLLEVCALSF